MSQIETSEREREMSTSFSILSRRAGAKDVARWSPARLSWAHERQSLGRLSLVTVGPRWRRRHLPVRSADGEITSLPESEVGSSQPNRSPTELRFWYVMVRRGTPWGFIAVGLFVVVPHDFGPVLARLGYL